MTKKAEKKAEEKRPGTQAGHGAGAAWAEVLAPLVAGMTATRASVLEWVHAWGLVALQAVCTAEATALAGPKGQHHAERTQHHWGRTGTELTLGGRRFQVARPRVRSTEGQEAVLPSVAAWRQRDPLTARVLAQIVLGVSARGYAGSLEPGPVGARSRGPSKRAVSRTVRGRLTAALEAQLHQPLDTLELLALCLDGGKGLRRCFATTNCIENLLGIVRHVTPNVTRWRDGTMIRRWVGLGLARATARFRRITGHRELATLATALRKGEPAETAA